MIADAEILEYNPWWTDPARLESDVHLAALAASPFHWTPPVLAELRLRPGDAATLRGPRQVGKTTSLKRLIADLVAKGETRVLYCAFDFSASNRDIPATIRRAKALHPDGDGPWYLFLDEITAVPEWTVGVEVAWDRGYTREDFVLCTGSSARQMGAEQLVGRRGRGHDYLQLPMSFRDYCTAVCGLPMPDALAIEDFFTRDGLRRVRELYVEHEAIGDALRSYCVSGGFPKSIADVMSRGAVAPETVRMFWDMIASDVQQAGHDKLTALKLLERVSILLGSPFVWSAAGEAMDVADVTVRRYAQLLAEGFALLILYHWDLAGAGLETRPPRKLYPIDPLIQAIAPMMLRQSRPPSDDAVIEALIAIALYRCATHILVQAEPLPSALGYWKSAKGHEIDFVVETMVPGLKAARLPVEVKGDAKRRLAAARQSIAYSFGRGLIVSRTAFAPDSDIPIIPAPVFLAALGERTQRLQAGL